MSTPISRKSALSGILTVIILIVIVVIANASMYVIRENEQAIITQFGRPIGEATTEAGVHFKTPFIQRVRRLEKRILTWDGDANKIPTKDKKYIFVDTTARWLIDDPLKFIQTVQTYNGARNRLDDILDGATRNVISKHNLVEAVRDSNSILEKLDVQKAEAKKRKETGEVLEAEEEEVFGEITKIEVGREQLSQMIVLQASEKISGLGISLIDVQLRRISYDEDVENKVYDRMISERNRIAEKIRSIGKGEQAKIEGKTSKDLQRIESEAYKQAQITKAKAEAKAIAIYARALSADPNFYNFIRTMDAYKKTFKEKTEFILSTDSDFLNQLRKP